MKQKIISIAAALALCLSLLPGIALALEETPAGVKFENRENSVTLADGKTYVAAEENKGITEWTGEGEPTDPYLSYSGTTLTVHGAFETTATITANSDLTITGGEGSSLTMTGANGMTVQLGNNSTLTLDGSVNFTANSSSGPVIDNNNSTVTFGAADSYSGKIVLSHTDGRTPAVSGATLDVQNSGSIEIRGQMSTGGKPAVLNSESDISIKPGVPLTGSLSIKGADVELIIDLNAPVFTGQSLDIVATGNVLITNENESTSSPAPALTGNTVISAEGDVTISSKGIPALAQYGSEIDLTIKKARNVSITGDSSRDNAFFTVPVTFKDCGSVTVTDACGTTKPLVKEGVTLTSDVPVRVTKNSEEKVYADGELWDFGGNIPTSIGSSVTSPTAYQAGIGWAFYEPPETPGAPATLTLDGAYAEQLAMQGVPVRAVLKGENMFKNFIVQDGITLTGDGGFTGMITTTELTNNSTGTVNAVVCLPADGGSISHIVYGNRSTTDIPGPAVVVQENTPLTIADGATLTVDGEKELDIKDFEGLTNNGTIVNQGTITIKPQDPQDVLNLGTIVNNGEVDIRLGSGVDLGDTSTFIKGLNLSGGGKVTVEKEGADGSPVTESYTNKGKQLLPPAGTNGKLYLNDVTTDSDETTWDAQGYKWEVLETDNSTPPKIVKATLTLKEGFNAAEVRLPGEGAEVTVKTEGESLIDTLTYGAGDNRSTSIKLTFEGGKLVVAKHINFSGDVGTSVTIANGAVVEANGGITVSAAAAVDGTITVNGTLTASSVRGEAAVMTGKVSVGPNGKLEVSGDTGVSLGGKSVDGGKKDFTGAFTVQPGGRFEARCDPTIIYASTQSESLQFSETMEKDIIVAPDGYLPPDCVLAFSNGKKILTIPGNGSLFKISADNIQRPSEPTPPSGEGGGSTDSPGGGISVSATYTIKVEGSAHGKVVSDRARASGGSTVTLTVTPDSGYALDALTVTDSKGDAVKLTEKGGKYTFTMPGRDVTVRASFALEAGGYKDCPKDSTCPIWPYADASTTAWYHDSVHYCLENGLMIGYGSDRFGPRDNISRAQFAQILHNREDRPVVNYLMRFTDVSEGKWYSEAVRWAASEGIVEGYGNGTFGPDDDITREQLAVMLWRYAGSPAATDKELHFADAGKASGWALEALRWATENGIINGKGNGILDPGGKATRAETAQMLKNFLESK